MVWIKRNLFFVVGGVLALALLGGAGFYIYQSWTRNSDAFNKLNEIYNTLQNLAQQKPSPGNDKIDNTKVAKDEEKDVREWITQSENHFKPIASIPPKGSVTSEAYAAALRVTVDRLEHTADSDDVLLPPKYDFSFAAQRSLMKFANGSLEPLATQLGEVKTICDILFTARINSLDSIQRVRVSDDDAAGPQSDYLDQTTATNDLAILTPYVITFRSFTPELARVLAGFATASNAFIVKSINVQSAGTMDMSADATPAAPTEMPTVLDKAQMSLRREYVQPQVAPAPQPTMGKGGLQTILKEQLLRITLEVEFVKLLPKS